MAENERPEGEDKTLGAGEGQHDKEQNAQTQGPVKAAAEQTPGAAPFGAWPQPQSPDGFREFGGGSAWPPAGYPGQPPMWPTPPGAPGAGFWPPAGTPTPPAQGGFQGMPGRLPGGGVLAPPSEQPRGVVTTQPPPPAKTSPFLLATLGGMALLVILVPLFLFLFTHASPPTTTSNNPQATTAPNTPLPTAIPTTPPSFFTPAGTAPTSKQCAGSIGVPCYSPEQMQKAFSLTSLYQQKFDGSGQTIVLVDVGNTPTLESDLKAFDKAWGLPDPPSFKILQPFGQPASYSCGIGFDGLQLETTLDVEWSHAMAPGANIVVVIGANTEQTYFPAPAGQTTCGLYDLEQDVNYALDKHLGNIISISFGGSELGAVTDTSVDKANAQKELNAANSIFKRAASMGVTVLASTGDTGATNGDSNTDSSTYWDKPNISWPASDPYVLAVGGTTLTIQDDSGTYGSEVVWDDAGGGGATGGGLSALYNEPTYQKTVPNQAAIFQGKRGIPDLAFPAESNYALYATGTALPLDMGQVNPKWKGWTIIGGTSASSPCWAGIIAIADQMSQQMGGQSLGFIHPALYSLQGKGMHDITSGNNNYDIMIGNKHAVVQGYQAMPGYDLVSGWGTPIADQFIPALIQAVQQVGNTP